eukprot:8840-Prymnesium_polylepis.1
MRARRHNNAIRDPRVSWLTAASVSRDFALKSAPYAPHGLIFHCPEVVRTVRCRVSVYRVRSYRMPRTACSLPCSNTNSDNTIAQTTLDGITNGHATREETNTKRAKTGAHRPAR